jgi:hypothetical protein
MLTTCHCHQLENSFYSAGVNHFMKAAEYWYVVRGPKLHLVCIKPGNVGWAIFLDDILVEDGFSCAEEAALRASRQDFSNERSIQLFRGIRVHSDLSQWPTTRPETPFVFPNENN